MQGAPLLALNLSPTKWEMLSWHLPCKAILSYAGQRKRRTGNGNSSSLSRGMKDIERQAYMLFDGDCGVCTYSAERAKRIDRKKRFRIEPYQHFPEAQLRRWGLSYEQCARKVQVLSRRGRVHSGAFGINYFLIGYFPWSLLVILVYAIPVLLLLELLGYAMVAKYRHRISQWFGLKACLIKQ